MEYYITKLGNTGWYNFEELPQEENFIYVVSLNCGTDRKAVNRARTILRDKTAKIIIKNT